MEVFDNLSKPQLKKFIQTYNMYIQEFDFENEMKPLSIYDFYDREYQDYLDGDNMENIENQKDDLFIVHSTDVAQNNDSKEEIGYFTSIDNAREVLARVIEPDLKYTINKVELDTEFVDKILIEVYDGRDGLEWKSPLSDAEYNKFPKIKLDSLEDKYIGSTIYFNNDDKGFHAQIDGFKLDIDNSIIVTIADKEDNTFDVDWSDIVRNNPLLVSSNTFVDEKLSSTYSSSDDQDNSSSNRQ